MNTDPDYPSQTNPHDIRDLSVGEILRRTRMHYGRSLEDVESVLRIRTSLLEALEADDTSKLPGRVYAIGFIRSYAEYLGLDGNQIVSLFKQQLGQSALRPEYNFPVAADESKRPDSTVFIVSLIGLLILGGSYQLFKGGHGEADKVQYRAEIMDTEDKAVSESAASNVLESIKQGSTLNHNVKASDGVWPPKVEDVMPEMMSSLGMADTDKIESVAQNAVNITAQSEAPDRGGIKNTDETSNANSEQGGEDSAGENSVATENDEAQRLQTSMSETKSSAAIRIVAKDPTWMQIKDTDGSVVFTGILKKGHDIKVPAEAMGWRMDTGNAGGLEIYIGDDKIPPLGGNGIVVRRIPLFADALRDYAR